MSEVAARLVEVRGRIAAAARTSGRDPHAVTLVAVSKKQPADRVRAAYDAGQRVFGENYVQGLVERRAMMPDAELHLIGHLQSNKVKLAASNADVIQTIDSAKLGEQIARVRPMRVLIEVHLGGEDTKSGVAPEAVEPLLASLRMLDVQGLMTIPPEGQGRRHFAELRELAERLRAATGLTLPVLSMGMSADFEDAIAEGATLVRVGSRIFGDRIT